MSESPPKPNIAQTCRLSPTSTTTPQALVQSYLLSRLKSPLQLWIGHRESRMTTRQSRYISIVEGPIDRGVPRNVQSGLNICAYAGQIWIPVKAVATTIRITVPKMNPNSVLNLRVRNSMGRRRNKRVGLYARIESASPL